jgi:ABC-type dipeptide/oligopeptide/nickel transport system permease subunit
MTAIQRILRSREARKLLRNKSAIVALVVIAGYVLLAIAVLCNVISREDCSQRVGANNLSGFYRQESPERRYEVARSSTGLFKRVRRALGTSGPTAALKEVKLGRFKVADKSLEELQGIIDEASEIQKVLNTSKNLDVDPAMLPKLVEFEEKVAELAAPLSGWDRFMQNASLLLGTDAQGRSIFFRGI